MKFEIKEAEIHQTRRGVLNFYLMSEAGNHQPYAIERGSGFEGQLITEKAANILWMIRGIDDLSVRQVVAILGKNINVERQELIRLLGKRNDSQSLAGDN